MYSTKCYIRKLHHIAGSGLHGVWQMVGIGFQWCGVADFPSPLCFQCYTSLLSSNKALTFVQALKENIKKLNWKWYLQWLQDKTYLCFGRHFDLKYQEKNPKTKETKSAQQCFRYIKSPSRPWQWGSIHIVRSLEVLH